MRPGERRSRRRSSDRTRSWCAPVRSAFLTALACGLGCAVLGGATVQLAWRDHATNEAGFIIERAAADGAFATLAVVGPDVETYRDATAVTGTRYRYRILAFNAAGRSAPSNTVAITAGFGSANVVPVISALESRRVRAGEVVAPITFTVMDRESGSEALDVVVWSSNPDLIPATNIAVAGAGVTRTLTLRPVAGRGGAAVIRLSVDDGQDTATASFLLVVDAPAGGSNPDARVVNFSTRVANRSDRDPAIVGLTVGGPGDKRVLLRAAGPGLARPPIGLAGALPDPRMTLKRWTGSGFSDAGFNDDWGVPVAAAGAIREAAARVFAFPFADGSADAAMLVDLGAGLYTAVVEDGTRRGGIAMLEAYDTDPASSSARLVNLSTRGFVGRGDEVMIAGFVVSGSGTATVLIRAVGPTLGQPPYHVSDPLRDPVLELHRNTVDGTDTLIAVQDDWDGQPDAAAVAQAAALTAAFRLPAGSADAALVASLAPGAYTAVVRGKGGAAGTALVEVYRVD